MEIMVGFGVDFQGIYVFHGQSSGIFRQKSFTVHNSEKRLEDICDSETDNIMTFKRGNGTDYFERHHFIKRNGPYTVQQMPALQDIINDDDNIICLCSNCHNQLHYGETQEIQLMIEKLCEDRQIQDMLEKHNFMKCIGVSNEQDAVQWIKEVYLSAI